MLAFIDQVHIPEGDFFPVLSLIFFLFAICHALLSDRFLALAHRHEIDSKGLNSGGDFLVSFYSFMGNITCIFALWLIPIFTYLAYSRGGDFVSASLMLQEPGFNEVFFNFILIAIAMTKPLRLLYASILHRFGFMFKNHLMFFWLGSFLLTVLLTGLLSEIVAMTLQCMFLAHFFYNLKLSKSLSYFTLALLLVCAAFGNTVIPFNLSDIYDFHLEWGWSHWTVFQLFGWKSFISIAIVASLGAFWFRKEFSFLQATFDKEMEEVSHHPINSRLLFYLGLLIVASLSRSNLYVMFASLIVVMILHKEHYKTQEEGKLHLTLPLMIAFFTYTIEIYASLQSWWVIPMLEDVQGSGLFAFSFLLTGMNEHVPISAVKTTLQAAPEMDKFLSYLGMVAGGGITLFANSANILAKKTLSPHFENQVISPIRQMLTSIPIALAVSMLILLFTYISN